MSHVDARPVLPIANGEQVAKRFATLQARAALRGATLIQIESDTGQTVFIVGHGAYCKEFRSIGDAEALIDRLEGRRTPPALADQAGT